VINASLNAAVSGSEGAEKICRPPGNCGSTNGAAVDPQFPGGRQIFSAFLAEPRTYGITGRFRF